MWLQSRVTRCCRKTHCMWEGTRSEGQLKHQKRRCLYSLPAIDIMLCVRSRVTFHCCCLGLFSKLKQTFPKLYKLLLTYSKCTCFLEPIFNELLPFCIAFDNRPIQNVLRGELVNLLKQYFLINYGFANYAVGALFYV